jgi:hydroxyethylthiazole kinase-like uncharacterized protein yjeF
MKIFTSLQTREWDQYTIQHEPVLSIDLMERAALRCTDWIRKKFNTDIPFYIFCGSGNNGGDGFAIARQLYNAGFTVNVYTLSNGNNRSKDNQINLQKLTTTPVVCTTLFISKDFPTPEKNAVIIDALFGSGINRPLEGLDVELVSHINGLALMVVAIDVPSGMFTDRPSVSDRVIRANYTLSFQLPKLCFLIPENETLVGDWQILDIGLSETFYKETDSEIAINYQDDIRKMIKKRSLFGHKGTYGHAALIAGSYGMLGAAMLAGKACLRSGAGKLTLFCTADSYPILQVALPEAIFKIDNPEKFPSLVDGQYNAMGIGPGIGVGEAQKLTLLELFKQKHPLVIDADALNTLSEMPDAMQDIPGESILTPHLKEFERLFGHCNDGFERIAKAISYSSKIGIYIIVKGHYSYVATPEGRVFFNSTGNPGMATAGSGDVLTGILTGLLAQGYSPLETALIGMWLHGDAGDEAAIQFTQPGMIAGDIVHSLPQSFRKLI